MTGPAAQWRDDIDALQFAALGHGGVCIVHRLAFRRFLGFAPEKDDCLAYFSVHTARFCAAAIAKMARVSVPRGRNFHLTSRDIRRLTSENRARS